MRKKKTLILLLFVFSFTIGYSQKGNQRKANTYLSNGNFEMALEEYLLLAKEDPDKEKYNYRIAVCYLNTNFAKTKATPYLEKLLQEEGYDTNVLYLLGRAYHYGHDFDNAIQMFNRFLKEGGGSAASAAETVKQVEYCTNAKELLKFPLNVTFENLGSNINSVYPDYYPFVPANESFLVYNSRREDGSDRLVNGYFSANVYMANVENGEYTQGIPIKNGINTNDGSEEVVGLSAKGDVMLLYFDNWENSGDIYITNRKDDGEFEKPVILDEVINSKDQEIAATINPTKDIIIFASTRKGGFGGTDLYMSKKLPIGGWGPAQNLGPDINTPDNEDFPNFSPDGKTLYFSSTGHTSMGGYDIFKAKWDMKKKEFGNVRNLGYPINTAQDDMNFRVSESGRYGYIAAVRPEGFGDYDIYRVTFNEVEPKYTVIKGLIASSDTSKTVEDAFITITNKQTGDIFGNYMPNPYSKRYVMILPPGEYEMFLEATDFEPVEEVIKILDKSSFKSEMEKNYSLKGE